MISLPEDFREKLAEAARRARDRSPHRGETGPGPDLPACDELQTPHGPSFVRSLSIGPGEDGFEDTFRRISALETMLSCDPAVSRDLGPLASGGLERTVFLDLETTGFSSTPVFLAGTMVIEHGCIHVRQFFARDYSQEKSVLHAVASLLGEFEVLVTFNGKSYDVPFLKDRFCFHGLPFEPVMFHLDLLHPARRRWREELPDCRLVTLERHLCGRRRIGDVSGSEIPAVYHEFVRTGYSRAMRSVFHHNVLDLITLAELLCELATTKSEEQ